MGFKIHDADPYIEIGSVHGTDGLVVSPDNISGVAMIASTLKFPSGTIRFAVNESKDVPRFCILFDHLHIMDDRQKNDAWIQQIINTNGYFLEDIRSEEGKNIFRQFESNPFSEEQLDQACVWLSRRSLSMHIFLDVGRQLLTKQDAVASELIKSYFSEAKKAWDSFKEVLSIESQTVIQWDIKDQLLLEQRKYYVWLAEVFKQKVDLLFDLWEKQSDMSTMAIETVLDAIINVGVDQEGRFPQVFRDIQSILDADVFLDTMHGINASIDPLRIRKQYADLKTRYNLPDHWYHSFLGHKATLQLSDWELTDTDAKQNPLLVTEMTPLADHFESLQIGLKEHIISRYGAEYEGDIVYRSLHERLYAQLESVFTSDSFLDHVEA